MARMPGMQEQFPGKAMDGPNAGNAGAIPGIPWMAPKTVRRCSRRYRTFPATQ